VIPASASGDSDRPAEEPGTVEPSGATPAGSAAVAPPSDYRLMVPAGWTRIALDPEVWPRRIAALVEDRFRGVDNAPHLKAQMREEMAQRAQEAWAGGGVELYLASMDIAGVPVAASLLVTLLPYGPGVVKQPLEDIALALAASGENATMTQLPSGFALAHRYATDPAPGSGSTYSDTHYDVTLDVPGTDSRLLLSFSTPVEPLADALVELFESIAYSLTWRD
jgi:hypothetical protein